ncbi:MAG: 23S rRNA (pseudouridine(1915)-N(3))-methyltransferase RlmH [SAR324 cluster bacterium]|jgi:23S rRNA (pseudouridine1915-N3)-methyltransferase|nr:23S rRNA (pseudouridine(1915)-N(3))-methyltransferase RlmH [SAR324 cluster bacterium]MDP6209980.1 23S rRNA (pseudouridine(1915)-N(3))-methyltransferase RlmH [SAR324 cluster bacterium]MDP6295968.1 23S rRNA (pseudouridine(1915)-N(3))-methyltransferase RlmH [SAR324 cluster bacterium]|tara:strand:+ start:97 stop:570 length:474 start_codon:yes stop_codon:yes gene_type:complete
MRSIRLIWIGKTQLPFVQDGISLYLKKLSHYIKVETEEIRTAKYASGTVDQWRRQETEKLLKCLNSNELNVFLDENGKRQTSIGLAQWFEKQMPLGWPRVNLIIGGAYGFEKSLLPANVTYLRLSDMTFTHQMIRLILLEQLYRAFTIIRGEPYHHV